MTSVVGIVRFSVLSTKPSPFLAYQDRTFDEIASHILDEHRLAKRFQLFESICLPSMDAQSDSNFSLLVVAPQLLPDRWKFRLTVLASTRPYLKIFYADEKNFRMAKCSTYVLDLISEDTFYTFRLDDDDALSCDFIERINRMLSPALAGHAVSHCKGYYLDIDNGLYKIRPRVVPNLAVGFGYISHKNSPRTLFDVSEHHLNFHNWCPVITDARRDTFLAVTHGANDTGEKRRIDEPPLTAEAASAALREKGFGVELELYERYRLSGLADIPPASLDVVRADPRLTLTKALDALRKPTKQEIADRKARTKGSSRKGLLSALRLATRGLRKR